MTYKAAWKALAKTLSDWAHDMERQDEQMARLAYKQVVFLMRDIEDKNIPSESHAIRGRFCESCNGSGQALRMHGIGNCTDCGGDGVVCKE